MENLVQESSLFPITNLNAFVNLVETHIHSHEDDEPNLAFLSILFGYLEHELTVNRISTSDQSSESDSDASKQVDGKCENAESVEFPTLKLEIVEGLLEQFVLMIKAQVDKSLSEYTTRSGYATRQLCKRVSDVIWNGLLRSYHKDKAHIQSLFSYLTGRQLDCFGLAFVVVCACQILNYKDVHLVLSGDHAWAACGEDSKDMVEITWHGRGTEDRRGFLIDKSVTEKNWIYHGGKAVKCDRWMELVALIVSLNPSIDIHAESEEFQLIQYKLLHLLYERGHLDRYPMALGLYCELEESVQQSSGAKCDPDLIHEKSLSVVKTLYDDLHILPYCGKGHFCLRRGRHKEAIKCYAKAAQVASKYNYGKEDEELYKEMIEIANDLIPQALKDNLTLCEDAECYYDLINFYDGICLWEEDSSTPVLHSWWARYFTLSVSRFLPQVREFYKDEEEENGEDVTANTAVSSSAGDDDHSFRRSSRARTMRSPSAASDDTETESLTASTLKKIKNLKGSSPAVNDEDVANEGEKMRKPISKLNLCSQKMQALKNMLTNGKKINSQAVGLLLTAQSQVHFVKRRSNAGDYSMEYGGIKRGRRSKD